MTTGTTVPLGQYTSATTDQSHLLLDRIFNFDQIIHALTSGSYDAKTTAVGSMFHLMNYFGVIATGMVLISMLSIAVMQTAHDGEPFGKRYSTLWMPIRSALAVAFAAPVKGLGGFSFLQVLILALVALSINGANMIYQGALDFFQGNDYSLMAVPDMSQPDPTLAANILRSEVCMDTVDYKQSEMTTEGAILPEPLTYGVHFEAKSVNSYPTVDCGRVRVNCDDFSDSNTDKIAKGFCQVKGKAVETLIAKLSPIAENIVTGKQPKASAFQSALTAYQSSIQKGVSALQSGGDSTVTNGIKTFIANAKSQGWITAGEWYWTLSAMSLRMQKGLGATAGYTPPDYKGMVQSKEVLAPELKRVDVYLKNTQVAMNNGGANGGGASTTAASASSNTESEDSSLAAINHIFGSSFGSGLHVLTGLLEHSNDPIRSLASYGQWMIGASWTTIGVATAMSAGADGASKSVLGWFGAGAAGGAMKVLLYPIMAIAGVAMGLGGFLAYYLPAIPFMFWMFGILGWLLVVVESLVAAPLWAASHAVPEGEGFAGRYAMQGWQLLVNVAFRPVLLTIGLLLSLFLMEAICFFAIHGYKIANQSIVDSTSSISITGFIFTNVIMCALVIVLSHKSHEIIYEGADSVMRWIGFGVSPLGNVKGGEQALSGTFSRATGQVEKAAMGAIGGSRKKGEGAPRRPGPEIEGSQRGGRNVTAGDTDAPQAGPRHLVGGPASAQAGGGPELTARPGGSHSASLSRRGEAEG